MLAQVTGTVDTAVTLAAWLVAHPRDVPTDSLLPPGLPPDGLCRVVTAPVEIAGHRFLRSAIFYQTDPSPGEELPDSAALAAVCPLRAIWLVTDGSDSVRAMALMDSVGRELGAGLRSLSTDSLRLAHSASMETWARVQLWEGHGVRVVSGIKRSLPALPWGFAPGGRVQHPSIVVAAFAPRAGLEASSRGLERYDIPGLTAPGARSLLDSTLAWAALPQLTVAMTPVLAQLRDTTAMRRRTSTSEVDSGLVRAARMIRDLGPRLAPDRRAAALLALDHPVSTFGAEADTGTARPDTRLVGNLLASAGVGYEPDPMNQDVRRYNHDALWRAFHLDSMGRAGHAALVELLAMHWETAGGCEDDDMHDDSVTTHGEAALQRGDSDPRVHYLVGLAYESTVARSLREAASEPPSATSRAHAERARIRAIEHLRAALRGLTDPAARRNAWRTAAALMLGHSRVGDFHCVYD